MAKLNRRLDYKLGIVNGNVHTHTYDLNLDAEVQLPGVDERATVADLLDVLFASPDALSGGFRWGEEARRKEADRG